MSKKLLLLSNSTNAGEAYLQWPRPYIVDFLQKYRITEAIFIPFAGVNLTAESVEKSYDIYEERVSAVFASVNCLLKSIHRMENPLTALAGASCIIIGGGNTFHLVKRLHETGMMPLIRERVSGGVPYIGWSAGANVACSTMMTTNDMPICQPPSFQCFGLIPFQINPHYLDANPEGHAGETREQRILEFLTLNRTVTVAGLREGCLLETDDKGITLKGKRPLRVFHYGMETRELEPGVIPADILPDA
jgi:dipeptidase E